MHFDLLFFLVLHKKTNMTKNSRYAHIWFCFNHVSSLLIRKGLYIYIFKNLLSANWQLQIHSHLNIVSSITTRHYPVTIHHHTNHHPSFPWALSYISKSHRSIQYSPMPHHHPLTTYHHLHHNQSFLSDLLNLHYLSNIYHSLAL